jgi:hypothetical protein
MHFRHESGRTFIVLRTTTRPACLIATPADSESFVEDMLRRQRTLERTLQTTRDDLSST